MNGNDNNAIIFLILLILRVIITIYCVNKAAKINRSKIWWGIFGFIFPIIAFIWIQFIKPKYIWHNPNSDEELHPFPDNKIIVLIKNIYYNKITAIILISLGILLIFDRIYPSIDFITLLPILFLVVGINLVYNSLVLKNKK
jgi:hypothetical protein